MNVHDELAAAQVDRGRDTSRELTEIRTVLGRAETALGSIKSSSTQVSARCSVKRNGYWTIDEVAYAPDPDVDEMIKALTDAVKALSKWRKTGAATKNVNLPEGARW